MLPDMTLFSVHKCNRSKDDNFDISRKDKDVSYFSARKLVAAPR